jgi:hypothetical protein
MGIGDWGLGIGDWGLGPIPNPQSPIPVVNNYESILSFLHLTNFRFAKRLLRDKRSLDSTVKIEIPKEVQKFKIIFI